MQVRRKDNKQTVKIIKFVTFTNFTNFLWLFSTTLTAFYQLHQLVLAFMVFLNTLYQFYWLFLMSITAVKLQNWINITDFIGPCHKNRKYYLLCSILLQIVICRVSLSMWKINVLTEIRGLFQPLMSMESRHLWYDSQSCKRSLFCWEKYNKKGESPSG